MEPANNFSKFGKSFQEDLCHLILNDRTFADQMFEVLDLNFLELKHLRVFISKVKEYRQKYGVHPTSNIMHSIIRTGLDGEPESVKVRIREYYARVLANGEVPQSSEYIKDTAISYIDELCWYQHRCLLRLFQVRGNFWLSNIGFKIKTPRDG